MIQDNSVLALITARGGSKGLPRKNVLPLNGRPLIGWSIEAAKNSRFVDRVIMSSDNDEINDAARTCGCEVPFVRPAELARDEATSMDVVFHALKALDTSYDFVVLLQPTSPLRIAEDIDGCLELCLKHGAPACVSVTEPDKSPFWMYTLDQDRRMRALIPGKTYDRRQDTPIVFALNGAVYVARTKWLVEKGDFVREETIAYPMPKERSIDIDTKIDLRLAELMIKETQP